MAEESQKEAGRGLEEVQRGGVVGCAVKIVRTWLRGEGERGEEREDKWECVRS